MSILISCIGGSDPIRSGFDGPLLNIIRNYKDIDKCYMFMSAQCFEIHNNPNKNYYIKAYNRFMKDNNRVIDFQAINLQIEKVNEFDMYFDVFSNEFKRIITSAKNGEKIYVNLTSGTPQMQTSLALVVQRQSYINVHPLQVNNFEFDSKNKSVDTFSNKYDIDGEIEMNAIVDEKNRCQEIKLFTIFKNNIYQQIIALLKIYDYATISNIFKDMLEYNSKLKALVLFSKYRQEMNYEKAVNILDFAKLPINKYLPLYNCTNYLPNIMFEYYLQIKNLINNRQFNDMIIRIDLFTIELQIEFLKRIYKFDINKFKDGKFFSIEKLEQFDISLANYINIEFNKKYVSDYNNSYINISLLNIILSYYCGENDNEIIKFFIKLEDLHSERNSAAHKLNIITQNDILKIISIDKIIKMFEKILKTIYPQIKEEYFNSYDNNNKEIIELIN